MAVQVHGFRDLLAWADSKTCGPWKYDRSCGHDGCVQAQRAFDVLSAAVQDQPGVWTLDEAVVRLST